MAQGFIPTPRDRLERVLALIEGEVSVLQVERKIRSRVKRQMEKTQREYYLNEQLKAIQKELGEGEEGRDELNELEERIKKAKLSKEAREKSQGIKLAWEKEKAAVGKTRKLREEIDEIQRQFAEEHEAEVERFLDAILLILQETGVSDDARLLVLDVPEAIRIRTGEMGTDAI